MSCKDLTVHINLSGLLNSTSDPNYKPDVNNNSISALI